MEWLAKSHRNYEESLKIKIQLLGSFSVPVANTYYNIGTAMSNLLYATNGIEYLEKALSIYDALLGSDHIKTILTQKEMAKQYLMCKEAEQALNLIGEIQKKLECKNMILYNTQLIEILTSRGHAYFALAQYTEAVNQYECAYQKSQKYGKRTKNDDAFFNYQIGRALCWNKNVYEGLERIKKSIESARTTSDQQWQYQHISRIITELKWAIAKVSYDDDEKKLINDFIVKNSATNK